MLTIFSAPKPFRGHISIIQQNAILSWTKLQPRCEIILIGDETGTAQMAKQINARHIPDVRCNSFGTPLVNDIFRLARETSRFCTLCYVNADIIFLNSFLLAVQQAASYSPDNFLLVGQRWNTDITQLLDFSDPQWEEKLIQTEGKKQSPSGIDYFVFPKPLFREMPDFVVGRPAWDNWMIYAAKQNSTPVIDLTVATRVIHQNHHYEHVPHATGKKWLGPEANENLILLGGKDRRLTILDSTYVLNHKRLKPAREFRHLKRKLQRIYLWFRIKLDAG